MATLKLAKLSSSLHRPLSSFSSLHLRSLFSTSMESTAATTTVEHVVLFKARAGADPSKIDAILANLRSLRSLPVVNHLTAGPVHRLRSPAAASLGFTHLLHCRYGSKSDLATYTDHPSHVAVVKENAPVIEDVTAVDWVIDGQWRDLAAGSALRFVLAKGTAADVVEGMKGKEKALQLSYGENFSPARAKGFTSGFLSVWRSVEEMEAAEVEESDAVAVIDYVVPSID